MMNVNLARTFKSLLDDNGGSVSTVVSGFMILMIAGTALSVQASDLYVAKLKSQRTADLANLAAASIASATNGGTVSATATAVANNVVAINGFAGATVTQSTDTTGSSLTTALDSTRTLMLGALFGGGSSTTVNGTASATITKVGRGCVAAFTNMVSIMSGATLQGSSCGVYAAMSLYAVSSVLNVAEVLVGYSAAVQATMVPGSTLTPPLANFVTSSSFTDTLANHASIKALESKIAGLATWPYSTTIPLTPTSPLVSFGTSQTYSSQTVTAPTSIGNLTVSNSTITFNGSGSADANCTNPTVIAGTTNLNGTNTLTFGSGCYIFKGDVTVGSGSTTFTIAANATVRFIFGATLINNSSGSLTIGDATMSMYSGIRNNYGGSIRLGNGSKAIQTQIFNGFGYLTMGNGPFYINNATVSQGNGTFTFGDGPFYFYGSTFQNGPSATMILGLGPYYVYASSITSGNGTAAPYMRLSGGPYYFGSSTINLTRYSASDFGPGDWDLSGSNITAGGDYAGFGWGGSATSGTGTMTFNGGTLTHSSGHLMLNGMTVATNTGSFISGGSSLRMTAPTASSPSAGYQNVLFYSRSGGFSVYPPGTPWQTLSGTIYAPSGTVNLGNGQTIISGNGGCLGLFGTQVIIGAGANVTVTPCSGLTVGTPYLTTSVKLK